MNKDRDAWGERADRAAAFPLVQEGDSRIRSRERERAPEESVPARRAYCDYRDMPAPRSLERLVQDYRTRSAPEAPPTKRLETLKAWSRAFNWQGRLAAEEARQDALKRQVADEEMKKKEIARIRRLENVGNAALAVGEALLRQFVIQEGPHKGQLNPALAQRVSPRDLAPMVRVGLECVQLAAGAPTEIAQGIGRDEVEVLLAEADEATRFKIVEGLRALVEAKRQRDRAGHL